MCGLNEIAKANLRWHHGFQSQPPNLNIEKEPKYKAAFLKFEGPRKYDKPNSKCPLRQIKINNDSWLPRSHKEKAVPKDNGNNVERGHCSVILCMICSSLAISYFYNEID